MRNTSKVKSVSKSDDLYSVSLEDCSVFGLDAKYGVEPKVGDELTLHKVKGSTIRGVDINRKVVFYKTDEQLEQERKEWLENNEKEKQASFAKNKVQMDSDYNELPAVFQQRIDKFRESNPRFRVDYEGYELFCCMEAVKITNAIKTKEGLDDFRKMPYEQQKEVVPDLSEGHSGNTFGSACKLAHWYLTNPDNVTKEHGALTPLVGCAEYGCPHSK